MKSDGPSRFRFRLSPRSPQLAKKIEQLKGALVRHLSKLVLLHYSAKQTNVEIASSLSNVVLLLCQKHKNTVFVVKLTVSFNNPSSYSKRSKCSLSVHCKHISSDAVSSRWRPSLQTSSQTVDIVALPPHTSCCMTPRPLINSVQFRSRLLRSAQEKGWGEMNSGKLLCSNWMVAWLMHRCAVLPLLNDNILSSATCLTAITMIR